MKKVFGLITAAAIASASASPIVMSLDEFWDTSIGMTVTIDDEAYADYFAVTADVNTGYYGDIVAMYVDFSSLPAGLDKTDFSVIGSNNRTSPTSVFSDPSPTVVISNNNVLRIPGLNYTNLNGDGATIAPFDVGVATGTQGLKNDLDPVTVLIKKSGVSSVMLPTLVERVGVRLQSVGVTFDAREGSSKVVYDQPPTNVPEPSSLSLLIPGLLTLLGLSRFRSRKSK